MKAYHILVIGNFTKGRLGACKNHTQIRKRDQIQIKYNLYETFYLKCLFLKGNTTWNIT